MVGVQALNLTMGVQILPPEPTKGTVVDNDFDDIVELVVSAIESMIIASFAGVLLSATYFVFSAITGVSL